MSKKTKAKQKTINDSKRIQNATRVALEASLVYILRNNFYAYCRYYDPDFYTPERTHLKTIADSLQMVTDQAVNKLGISVPPRGGKSYTVSLWCSWTIGRMKDDPDLSLMRNSYASLLAEKFSYDIRGFIQSPKFEAVFGKIELKKDHRSVDDWAIETSKQSTYFCAGVGGGVTGKGCKTAAIADDLVKNLEEALSEVVLDKIWGWYTSTHMSRMEQDCPQIVIATRWSRKDPTGRLMEEEGVIEKGGEWTIVKIPALVEEIDENEKRIERSYCPSIKSTEQYQKMKKLLDTYVWNAEFMQEPIEAAGLVYPIEELLRFKMKDIEKETKVTVVGVTDIADEGDNYLASITADVIDRKAYITDVVFTQDPIEKTQPLVAGMILRHKHKKHRFESNNGGKGYALNVRELVKKAKGMTNITWKKTVTNKETRILMASGVVKENVYFRSDYIEGSDYDRFMSQLTSYVRAGKNKFDDAADVVTMLAELLFRFSSINFFNTEAY